MQLILNERDINNLLIFLDRATMTGNEALVYTDLRNKLISTLEVKNDEEDNISTER